MAAGAVKGITVEIGGDTTKLGKAIESSEKKTRELQKELKQVNTALKFNPESVELLTQKQKILSGTIESTRDKLQLLKDAEAQVAAQFASGEIGEEQFRAFQRELIETESKLQHYQAQLEETGGKASALDELTNTISDQEREVEQLKEQYKEAVLQYGKNSEEAKDLAKQIDTLSSELKENKDKMSELDSEADALDNSIEDVGESAQAASDGFTVMKGVLADLIATGIRAAVNELKDLAKQAMDAGMYFESSMAKNAALFGATDKEVKQLSDAAMEYGETTVFSAGEVSDALGYMALAGYDAAKATKELPGVLNLAAASGMDLAQSSDMVTDYLSAFSNSAMTASQFADKLAYAQANSNTTAEQLGEAYKNSAANLNAAGQSVETVTSLLAAMADRGLKGSEAGTALAAVMRDLTQKMKDGKIHIGDTTVAVQDANGNYRNLLDILKDVESATYGMGDAEKAAALSATFTADSIKGVNLIMDAGLEQTAAFAESLRDCDGAAGNMADTMNDTVEGAIKRLKGNIETKMIKVFTAAEGSIKDAIGSVSASLDRIDWSKVARAVGDVAKGIADLFAFIVDNADTILATLKAIAIAFVTYKATTIILGVIESFRTLYKTIKEAEGVMSLFNGTMAANPIALAIGAAAGLVSVLFSLKAAGDEAAASVAKLSEEEQALIDKVKEDNQAFKDAAEARREASNAIQEEYGYYERLWGELHGIVDENGKVKKGYEDRAAVITGLLSDALGVEISIVDGQIQKYKELEQEIDNLIEKKKTEAILDAYKPAYAESLQKRKEAWNDYTNALETSQNTQKNLDVMIKQREELLSNPLFRTPVLAPVMNNVNKQIDAVTDSLNEQKQAAREAGERVQSLGVTTENYEAVLEAFTSGNVDAMSDAVFRLTNDIATGDQASREMLTTQLDYLKERRDAAAQYLESGAADASQKTVEQFDKAIAETEATLAKMAPIAHEKTVEAGYAAADGLTKSAPVLKETAGWMGEDTMAALTAADFWIAGQQEAGDYAGGATSLLDKIKSTFKGLSDASNAELTSADTAASGKASTTGYITGASSLLDAVRQTGIKIGNTAKTGAGSVDLTSTGSAGSGQYQSGLGSNSSAISATATGLANVAKAGLSSVDGASLGWAAGSGFASGISKATDLARRAAINLANTAVTSLRNFLAINSPSKVTEESGESFGTGFAGGVTKSIRKAVKAVTQLATDSANALQFDSFDAGALLYDQPPVDYKTIMRPEYQVRFAPELTEVLQKLDAVTSAINANSGNAIVLDTGALVGATIHKIDSGLANVYGMKARGG